MTHNERLSSWLNPIINVLYAFSATLGGGVGLVRLNDFAHRARLVVFADILARKYHLCPCRGSPVGEYPSWCIVTGFSALMSVRLPRISTRAKPLPISLNVLRTSSNGLNHTRKCHQVT